MINKDELPAFFYTNSLHGGIYASFGEDCDVSEIWNEFVEHENKKQQIVINAYKRKTHKLNLKIKELQK